MSLFENETPFEVVAGPFKAYWGPVGESFPAVDLDPPGGNWALIGNSGPLNYLDSGVVVGHPQTVNLFTPLGSTGPMKAFRVAENLTVTFSMADVRLEGYRLALNQNSITTVAAGSGTAGYKKLGMTRDPFVNQIALLIRGASPYMNAATMQYEIPRCVHIGEPSVNFQKGEPAALELAFQCMVDPDAASDEERFGVIRAMTAVAI